MIRNFRTKGLKELFQTGESPKIGDDYKRKIIRILDFLNVVTKPEDMDIPGFNFHGLKGKPKRYSVHVNGNYCITFAWEGEDAIHVKFEDYH
ncbi:MAG: type II toxin-antitoxin system RelE/ParE family toxin [Gammaproteobacteria bacterium]|jgi:proteic killer suppression protein